MKQFALSVTDRSLLRETVLRLDLLAVESVPPLAVHNETHGAHLASRATVSWQEPILLILPADHVITPPDGLATATAEALKATELKTVGLEEFTIPAQSREIDRQLR